MPAATSRRLERVLAALLAVAALQAVVLDGWLLSRGLVKMEIANAHQLELHALVRDGLVVLGESPAYYADALHHLPFHALLLVSPDLEVVGGLLNLLWYGFAVLLYRGTARRLGRVAALVATTLFVAAPVAPILSKHVISTAFVPPIAAAFTFAVLDLAGGAGRGALGRALAALGVLVALNHGHVVYAIPLVAVAARARVGPPPWSLAALAATQAPALVELAWLGPPDLRGLWTSHYPTAWSVVQRFVHIENGIENTVPVAWGLFGIVAVGLAIVAFRHEARPSGLAPLLLVAPLLVPADPESVISWQTPLFVALACAGRAVPAFAVATSAYAATYGLAATLVMTSLADRPNVNFFSMSAARLRTDVLDVLVHRMGMRADEFERLRLEHGWEEDGLAATRPGLSYVRDRVGPALPPGGDRCFLVDDVGRAPPPGAIDVERVEAHTLVFQAWRGTPCEPNVRLPLPEVVWLDLGTLTVHAGVPPTGPREGR